jgi:type IV pilus assembly protein PilV
MTMATLPRVRRPVRRPPQSGFSLIEVMVSIVLVSIGLVGLLGLLATTTQTSNNAQDRNRAAMLVNELVTDMWLNGSTDTTTGNLANDYTTLKAAARDITKTDYYLAPNATFNVALAGTTATITLSWTPPNQAAAKVSNTSNTYDNQVVNNVYTTQIVLP